MYTVQLKNNMLSMKLCINRGGGEKKKKAESIDSFTSGGSDALN